MWKISQQPMKPISQTKSKTTIIDGGVLWLQKLQPQFSNIRISDTSSFQNSFKRKTFCNQEVSFSTLSKIVGSESKASGNLGEAFISDRVTQRLRVASLFVYTDFQNESFCLLFKNGLYPPKISFRQRVDILRSIKNHIFFGQTNISRRK